jgi:hypothetical protein
VAFLFVLVAFGTIGIILGLTDLVQASRCPVGTFWHRGSDDALGILLPIMVLFFGVSPVLTLWLYRLIPGVAARWSAFEAKNKLTAMTFSGTQKVLSITALVSLTIAVPTVAPQFFVEICLTPTAIWNQASVWGGFRRYGWEDISTVAVTCDYVEQTKSPSYWSANRVIYLKDGVYFGFSGKQEVNAFHRITAQLHGRNFRFDTSGVAKGCAAKNLPLLLQRP